MTERNSILLSAAVIALNEEERLPDCLRSLDFADEIVLVDSGSRDNTIGIAESFGCRVISRNWPGYAAQKQYAVDQCRNDWVFILDADERVSPEAGQKIKKIIQDSQQQYAAFRLARKSFFHKRWIRHCGWWPDRVIRVVDRRKGEFSRHSVHERWISHGPVKDLDLNIEHYSFRNYAEMINKMQNYSDLAAADMFGEGKRAGWWTPVSHGFWMFLRTYFLELGIVEGFDGFFISLMNAGGSFMKYAKLRETLKFGSVPGDRIP